MYRRLISISESDSFFLFGARGTGKSTLLDSLPFLKRAYRIDLLNQDIFEELSIRPQLLFERCMSLQRGSWVAIDEVQKIPELLDVVHSLIEQKKFKFALTGSSSRKLKRRGANLLAGRALLNTLFPLTSTELGKDFDLENTLQWGSLPKVLDYKLNSVRNRFLKTYVQTYLKEEVVAEQLVRNLTPFRLFLPIAAQMNSKTINFSNIAKDTGVDFKTIQSYFEILCDTYMGSFLECYNGSVRKVQIQAPKFYFFDLGIKRALQKQLTIPLVHETNTYGEAFETWFINQCISLNSYYELDYELSYLRTKDDAEVDLIISRPDGSQALVEIKSSTLIDERHLKHLLHFKKDFPQAQFICASRVKTSQMIKGISVLHWEKALEKLGFVSPAVSALKV